MVVWSWGWEQWSWFSIVGKPVAGVGGAVVACPPGRVCFFGLTEGAGNVAAATLGGDVGRVPLSWMRAVVCSFL